MAKRKTHPEDDGRVIANMNVDGMPWYLDDARKKQSGDGKKPELSNEETRYVIWGAIKAGLLIAGVFILGALLFILFCIYIWF